MRWKWWDSTDLRAYGVFYLGLDGRVGIHSLEDSALQDHVHVHLATNFVKVLAEYHQRNSRQDNVSNGEVKEDL